MFCPCGAKFGASRRLTRMRIGVNTVSTCLDTNQSNARVLDKVVERSNGVTSTSNTGHNGVGQFTGLLSELRLDFTSDNSLEISDNGGEWVRADSRSDQVVGGIQTSDPFSHCFVDGVFECLRSGSDWHDLASACGR